MKVSITWDNLSIMSERGARANRIRGDFGVNSVASRSIMKKENGLKNKNSTYTW